jgi:hypothetical protein
VFELYQDNRVTGPRHTSLLLFFPFSEPFGSTVISDHSGAAIPTTGELQTGATLIPAGEEPATHKCQSERSALLRCADLTRSLQNVFRERGLHRPLPRAWPALPVASARS